MGQLPFQPSLTLLNMAPEYTIVLFRVTQTYVYIGNERFFGSLLICKIKQSEAKTQVSHICIMVVH